MSPPDQEIERRRPVWEALSSFFLDAEFDDEQRRHIAGAIVASAYSPAEVQTILWDEVYPVLKSNLRHPAGEWTGFDLDWLQAQILSAGRRTVQRAAGALSGSPAPMVRKEWAELLLFLPEQFRRESDAE